MHTLVFLPSCFINNFSLYCAYWWVCFLMQSINIQVGLNIISVLTTCTFMFRQVCTIEPIFFIPFPLACIVPFSRNFDFNLRSDYQKNFLWASRLWVGRQKEPILGYVSKNDENKNSGLKGLIRHQGESSSLDILFLMFSFNFLL